MVLLPTNSQVSLNVSALNLDNQPKAQGRFTDAFAVLTILGSNQDDLIDCSEVIPQPPAFNGPATFPAGFGLSDIEQGVR